MTTARAWLRFTRHDEPPKVDHGLRFAGREGRESGGSPQQGAPSGLRRTFSATSGFFVCELYHRSAVRSRLPPRVRTHLERLFLEADEDTRKKFLATLPSASEIRVLDVGCYDGSFTERVRARLGVGPELVSGVELVEARRKEALARGFDVRAADLDERWPFERCSFDLVVSNQVIEHVRRLDHFVSETRRVLAPGGRAVVCTENLASWHNVFALALGYTPFSVTNVSARGPIGNPFALHAGSLETKHEVAMEHVHILTLSGLRDLFAVHGFAIRDEFAAGYYPLSGRLASRVALALPRHAHFIGIVAEWAR
jgi:SAM-dependent methyltransferase